MINYELESIAHAADERSLKMLREHQAEVAHFNEVPVDWSNIDRYRQIEAAGALRLMVARENDELIGYAVFIVAPAKQRAGKVAQCDLVYVRPDKRFGRVGVNMLKAMLERLAAEGVTIVRGMSSTRVDTGPLWRWLGFELTGMIYERTLKGHPNA